MRTGELVERLRRAGCVFAEDEARLLGDAAGSADELEAMVERRVAGMPLEHVLGWAEFRGLRIRVDPDVFVPRRRTEFLVERAIALAAAVGRRPVVVDLCCGSGAVGAALAAAVGDIELHATDIDAAAVRCARRNVEPLGGAVYRGDLFEPLPPALRGRVDVLVANVPYVPTAAIGQLPPEARDHEPLVALDGGADGLDVLRRVTDQAARWLAPGGHLLMETSVAQAPIAVDVIAAAAMIPTTAHSEKHHATVVTATRPPHRER